MWIRKNCESVGVVVVYGSEKKKILARLFIGPPTAWQFSFLKLDKNASIFANRRCEKIEQNYISRYIHSRT